MSSAFRAIIPKRIHIFESPWNIVRGFIYISSESSVYKYDITLLLIPIVYYMFVICIHLYKLIYQDLMLFLAILLHLFQTPWLK